MLAQLRNLVEIPATDFTDQIEQIQIEIIAFLGDKLTPGTLDYSMKCVYLLHLLNRDKDSP